MLIGYVVKGTSMQQHQQHQQLPTKIVLNKGAHAVPSIFKCTNKNDNDVVTKSPCCVRLVPVPVPVPVPVVCPSPSPSPVVVVSIVSLPDIAITTS